MQAFAWLWQSFSFQKSRSRSLYALVFTFQCADKKQKIKIQAFHAIFDKEREKKV